MSNPLTPPARLIDPRGQRFGAGFSAVILAAAVVLNLPWVVALVALAMAASAGFGSQWLVPYEIQGGRLARVNVQFEF